MTIAVGIVGGLILFAWLLLTIVAGAIVMVHAFRRSVVDGLLYLFLPFYSLYYLFAKFDHPRRVGIIVVLLVAPFGLGMFSALGVYGVRKYVTSVKKAEGQEAVRRMADGVLASVRVGRAELPASAPPVPADLASLRARKYQSSPLDWQGNWTQIGFSMQDPQYFQYEWERRSSTSGIARARADLNGDGRVDQQLELAVDCTPGSTGLECQTAARVNDLVL